MVYANADNSDFTHVMGSHKSLIVVSRRTRSSPVWSGGIWAGSGPVPVDLAGTRPVPRFF